MKSFAKLCSGLLVFALSPGAFAASPTDGAYGRLDGDLGLQLDVGGVYAEQNTAAHVSLVARYVQSVGLYGSWTQALPYAPQTSRAASAVGLEFRPLFLPRFLKNMEQGPALLDLTLDSLSLRLGTFAFAGADNGLMHPGFETSLGLGLPLTGRASGPWLSGSMLLRWTEQQLASNAVESREPTLLWMLTFGWQSVLESHLVSLTDPMPR